jgi:hypothetical protein
VTVASASLRVRRDAAGRRYAGELFVRFTTPAKLGEMVLESDVQLEMTVTLQGARGDGQRAMMATPQPVWFTLSGQGNWRGYQGKGLPRSAWSDEGHGWIRFARIGLQPGDPFVAELVADGGAGVLAATAITGTVRGVVIE